MSRLLAKLRNSEGTKTILTRKIVAREDSREQIGRPEDCSEEQATGCATLYTIGERKSSQPKLACF